MKGRKLLAAALLAGMVSSPVIMAEVLSDEALGEVAAQGFQVANQYTGAANQNVNNDSVQLNDNAQRNAAGMAMTNSAASALNVGQNVAGVIAGSSDGLAQRNDQYAENGERSTQQALTNDEDWVDTAGTTLKDRQNMNNASAQLNNKAQQDAAAMAMTNAASSAVNVAQNVAGVDNSQFNNRLAQRNDQIAKNASEAHQNMAQNDSDTSDARTKDKDRQNVNNGSVQANDSAQKRAAGLAITNVAASASNTAQNVAGVVDSTGGATVTQSNDQYARNAANVMAYLTNQYEINVNDVKVKDRDLQNANNGAVQLNNKAQRSASGLTVTNAASSAANAAQNIVGADYSTVGAVRQNSKQVAENTAMNTQYVSQRDVDNNGYRIDPDLDRQNVNNGSVQANNNAQKNVSGLAVTNAASSASNTAQNVLGTVDSIVQGDVTQTNEQFAQDVSRNRQNSGQEHFDATGLDINNGEVNANNGSVQLNDNAQMNATGLIIGNIAGSAANAGQNIAGSINGRLGALTQTNVQSALNY
jgi:hypothetical protein